MAKPLPLPGVKQHRSLCRDTAALGCREAEPRGWPHHSWSPLGGICLPKRNQASYKVGTSEPTVSNPDRVLAGESRLKLGVSTGRRGNLYTLWDEALRAPVGQDCVTSGDSLPSSGCRFPFLFLHREPLEQRSGELGSGKEIRHFTLSSKQPRVHSRAQKGHDTGPKSYSWEGEGRDRREPAFEPRWVIAV